MLEEGTEDVFFWSMELKPDKVEELNLEENAVVNIRLVSYGEVMHDAKSRSVISLRTDSEDKRTALCVLHAGTLETFRLDFEIGGPERYHLSVSGKNPVFLTGEIRFVYENDSDDSSMPADPSDASFDENLINHYDDDSNSEHCSTCCSTCGDSELEGADVFRGGHMYRGHECGHGRGHGRGHGHGRDSDAELYQPPQQQLMLEAGRRSHPRAVIEEIPDEKPEEPAGASDKNATKSKAEDKVDPKSSADQQPAMNATPTKTSAVKSSAKKSKKENKNQESALKPEKERLDRAESGVQSGKAGPVNEGNGPATPPASKRPRSSSKGSVKKSPSGNASGASGSKSNGVSQQQPTADGKESKEKSQGGNNTPKRRRFGGGGGSAGAQPGGSGSTPGASRKQ